MKISILTIILSCAVIIGCSKKEESKDNQPNPAPAPQSQTNQSNAPLDLDSRLFEFSKKCYAPSRAMAAVLTASNGQNAEIYVLMTAAHQKIITDYYISKESDSAKGSIIYNDLYKNYKPTNLKDEEVNTDYGKSILAEHSKLENECAQIMKTDTELSGKFLGLVDEFRKSKTSSGSDPKEVAERIQIAGVSRCIATTIIMSASLSNSPNIKADGPEIKNNSAMMEFYSQAKKHLIQSSNNPAVAGAIDSMMKQQADYFGNIVRSQGWSAFMPEYKQCRDYTN